MRDAMWPSSERDGDGGIGAAALHGAVAALLGGLAMKLVWELGDRTLPRSERFGAPTERAVDDLARRAGADLGDRQRQLASLALYTAAMASWGAVFGVVQRRLHPPALAHGLVLGGLVYAANFTRVAPLVKSGLVPSVGEQKGRQRAVPLLAHAAFGVTTAAALEALS
jgi:hypothetical protein